VFVKGSLIHIRSARSQLVYSSSPSSKRLFQSQQLFVPFRSDKRKANCYWCQSGNSGKWNWSMVWSFCI